MMRTCCATPSAGPRYRCWPITCLKGRGWRCPGGPSRRCGSHGCAEGKITEIGPDDLSLSRDEASLLLRAAEVTLGDDEVAELYRQTEGWAAALYRYASGRVPSRDRAGPQR